MERDKEGRRNLSFTQRCGWMSAFRVWLLTRGHLSSGAHGMRVVGLRSPRVSLAVTHVQGSGPPPRTGFLVIRQVQGIFIIPVGAI